MRRRLELFRRRTPERRWAAVFKTCAHELLVLLLDVRPRHNNWRQFTDFLAHDLIDPNLGRTQNLRGVGA